MIHDVGSSPAAYGAFALEVLASRVLSIKHLGFRVQGAKSEGPGLS